MCHSRGWVDLSFWSSFVTYWFAEHVAMTINRILIVAISVVSSFFFRIYLSYVAAIICAVTAFFIPIVFWYPVHQYQMASVFYFLILIFSHRYFYKPTRVNLLLVQFLWVFMILSVSINHVIIFLPFWVIWLFSQMPEV